MKQPYKLVAMNSIQIKSSIDSNTSAALSRGIILIILMS